MATAETPDHHPRLSQLRHNRGADAASVPPPYAGGGGGQSLHTRRLPGNRKVLCIITFTGEITSLRVNVFCKGLYVRVDMCLQIKHAIQQL